MMKMEEDQDLVSVNIRQSSGKPGRLQAADEFTYWEEEVGLPPVEDQYGCGACWVFPAKTAMEAVYKQLKGVEKIFSAQYFVDCSWDYSGCAGGSPNDAFKITK